jgi:hypothetical protein
VSEAPDIRILAGDPTPEELAAVTAVLAAALDELASEHRRAGEAGMSAWDRSRRGLRQPLPRGAWRDAGS